MGVQGLWNALNKAGQSRSLAHLAVVDGFEGNKSGKRAYRVGIDASIWYVVIVWHNFGGDSFRLGTTMRALQKAEKTRNCACFSIVSGLWLNCRCFRFLSLMAARDLRLSVEARWGSQALTTLQTA
jgi:hypothetical protein